jgi:hypothetical protein
MLSRKTTLSTKFICIFFLCFFLFFETFSQKNDQTILDIAISKSNLYNVSNNNFVTIIDFNKSINEERLYVVDMFKRIIVIRTIVSHALESGNTKKSLLYAKYFSNELHSNKSSIGAYLTKTTYYGQFGYSLILKGLDKTNSNAELRNIIFHSNKKMHSKWSRGCFATPDTINRKLINLIKNGTLVYVFK